MTEDRVSDWPNLANDPNPPEEPWTPARKKTEAYVGVGTSPTKLGENQRQTSVTGEMYKLKGSSSNDEFDDESVLEDADTFATMDSAPHDDIFMRLSSIGRHHRSMRSSSSSSKSSMSSKITDEDLLDTIFQSCDVEKNGRVPASQLIEYIQFILLPSHLQQDKHIESLAHTLDPTGLNIALDLPTYHNRITSWVASFQDNNNSYNQETEECSDLEDAGPHCQEPPIEMGDAIWKSGHHKLRVNSTADTSLNISTFSYGSLEAYGGDTLDNKSNFQDRLEELRHQNRKISEHNSKLQTQLEATEEFRAELVTENEQAMEKLKSMTQRNVSLRNEVQELKTEMASLEDSNTEWQNKFSELEREKRSLEMTVQLLETEDKDHKLLESKLELLEQELDGARSVLQTKDKKLTDVNRQLTAITDRLLEKSRVEDELLRKNKELTGVVQSLKMEKSEMEIEMTGIKQQVTANHKRLRIEPPPNMDYPLLQSTPLDTSLQSELRIFVAESRLPSPLCGPVTYETGGKTEMMHKLQTTTENIITEVEKMVTYQQEEVPDASGGYLEQDGRGRFASVANAALTGQCPLNGNSFSSNRTMDSCRTSESKDGDSPKSPDKMKKKLSISLSNPAYTETIPPTSPAKAITPPANVTFGSLPEPLRPPAQTSVTPSTGAGPKSEEGTKGDARTKREEELFQQGFEQGVRSQISQELNDLRDQQRALCENLEEIMEAADEEDEEEDMQRNSIVQWVQQYFKVMPWSRATRLGRLVLTTTLFILAIISIIGTVIPLEVCKGGIDILSDPWEGVKRLLSPHVGLYHPIPPPT